MLRHIPSPSGQAPLIELVPMEQCLQIRSRNEDWTGKIDVKLRRKLQNRLNQRASRQRRKQGPEAETSSSLSTNDTFPPHSNNDGNVNGLDFPSSGRYYLQNMVNQPRRPTSLCVPQMILNAMNTIPCFEQFHYTPLPADQKLLTLMHFNLIRALCQCVDLLGFTPEEMYLDVHSPFVEPSYQSPYATQSMYCQKKKILALPPTMQPTALQKTMPHHPEVDIFPFPTYRDNILRAGHEINDVELCMDVTYGVSTENIWNTKKEIVDKAVTGQGSGNRTGLIVWSDPWLQSSWEVEEGFARKYARLLKGCEELHKSTNHWREMRGEEPINFSLLL